jgi:hypothetical protein
MNREKSKRLKDKIVKNCYRFEFNDNLFTLLDIMQAGADLLKHEGFPIKKYKIYESRK